MSVSRRIVLVVAAAENGVIGRGGGMPWRLPDDLKHFKAVTLGHPIIMGRRTWEELGCKPLPGRRNIVLTRNVDFASAGCDVAGSPEAALAMTDHADVMIVGGGQVYRLFMDRANVVERTVVHAQVDGDTTFPSLDDRWTRDWREAHEADDRHAHAFTFERWIRS